MLRSAAVRLPCVHVRTHALAHTRNHGKAARTCAEETAAPEAPVCCHATPSRWASRRKGKSSVSIFFSCRITRRRLERGAARGESGAQPRRRRGRGRARGKVDVILRRVARQSCMHACMHATACTLTCWRIIFHRRPPNVARKRADLAFVMRHERRVECLTASESKDGESEKCNDSAPGD